VRRVLAAVVVLILAAAACGGAKEDGGGPNGAGAAAQPGVAVVPHARLEALLPVLPGWTRQTPVGETDTTESVSRVTVDYEKPPSTLSFELMDSSKRAEVLALITEALAGKNSELTPTTLSGFPAAEQWIAEAQRGAVHILIAGRFMVVVTGEQVANLGEIRAAAAAIDLSKLAALK
jgi:hypothetical protein